ncbi:MAG: hypothetical protein ACXVJ7_15520 [Acidimicrobiia bacterium]
MFAARDGEMRGQPSRARRVRRGAGGAMTRTVFGSGFDPTYFNDDPWSERVRAWVAQPQAGGFSMGNLQVMRELLQDRETGIRMVVNITATAMLAMLAGTYKNLYERPVIGGEVKQVSDERIKVDRLLGLPQDTYFGAVALGGTGVRYYGEFCLVIRPDRVDPATGILDRDSYDLLNPPLDVNISSAQLDCLRGTWDPDVVEMALRRVLPEFADAVRLATSGTISEAVLRDQEFIEVHLRGTFGPADIDEVRVSPDDVAIENSISEREREGQFVRWAERRWVHRRRLVARALDAERIDQRVVTTHGKGYQWK